EDGIRYFHVTGVQTCALPICDPDRPRHLLDGGGNERAYDFEQLPSAQNWGLYIENSIKGLLGSKKYNANIGVRADIQNGYFTLQIGRASCSEREIVVWGYGDS